jgi:hypothetical protein
MPAARGQSIEHTTRLRSELYWLCNMNLTYVLCRDDARPLGHHFEQPLRHMHVQQQEEACELKLITTRCLTLYEDRGSTEDDQCCG